MISIDNLTVSFGGWTLFDGISFLVNPKERIGLVGKNGAGKTTILKLIAGLQQPTSGAVTKNADCTIGYLPQQMQVADTTTLIAETAKAFEEVLALVGLDNKAYKMPHELSGGEQQRLVIARSLINSPRLLLADEPTGNLDPVSADEIMRLFSKIASRGCAIIMSTHNTALIEQYPARTLLFSKGKMVEIDVESSFKEE